MPHCKLIIIIILYHLTCSDTALVILSHKKGFDALRCKKDRKKDSVTPMRMLIEHLPGLHSTCTLHEVPIHVGLKLEECLALKQRAEHAKSHFIERSKVTKK